jgi:hypothetical protein
MQFVDCRKNARKIACGHQKRVYAISPSDVTLEVEMTSDLGVERGIDHPFRFHCSCGAIIETTAKKEICRNCGETIEVVRCVPRPYGDKYTLRISKHRHGWNEQSTVWPPGIAGTLTRRETSRS